MVRGETRLTLPNPHRKDIEQILLTSDIIEEYPDDKPYPSALFSGEPNNKHLYVVAAFDRDSGCCFVVTTYRPDLDHFKSDYKTRRKR